MKKKILYLFVFLSWCSLLTSARKAGQYCDQSLYKESQKKSCIKGIIKPVGGMGVDLSPLNFFLSI